VVTSSRYKNTPAKVALLVDDKQIHSYTDSLVVQGRNTATLSRARQRNSEAIFSSDEAKKRRTHTVLYDNHRPSGPE
jgi:hypothetical protein